MASKTTAPSNSALRTVLATAAEDCAALLERCSPRASASTSARRDFWERHQEELALVAARATDAASTLLGTEDIDAWIVIASAIHELIEELCFGGASPARLPNRRAGPDAAADPQRACVEAALERAVHAATAELANRGIVMRQNGEPQQTPCGGHGEVAEPTRVASGWRPTERVGRGQLLVGGSRPDRLASGQEQVPSR